MVGRFELLLALRNQVADRARVRRALVVEATMEELAAELGGDAAVWGLAGLGADIDVMLCAENPERRGVVAEEILLVEGVPAEAAAAVRMFRTAAITAMPSIALALVVADAFADEDAGLDSRARHALILLGLTPGRAGALAGAGRARAS